MTEQKQPERKLTDEEILENATIADGMADSTHDGGPRPASSKPAIVTKTDYEAENPYAK